MVDRFPTAEKGGTRHVFALIVVCQIHNGQWCLARSSSCGIIYCLVGVNVHVVFSTLLKCHPEQRSAINNQWSMIC